MGNLTVLHRIEERLTRIAVALEKKNATVDMDDVTDQNDSDTSQAFHEKLRELGYLFHSEKFRLAKWIL